MAWTLGTRLTRRRAGHTVGAPQARRCLQGQVGDSETKRHLGSRYPLFQVDSNLTKLCVCVWSPSSLPVILESQKLIKKASL